MIRYQPFDREKFPKYSRGWFGRCSYCNMTPEVIKEITFEYPVYNKDEASWENEERIKRVALCRYHSKLKLCGSCGEYHRKEYKGDCRVDEERYPTEYPSDSFIQPVTEEVTFINEMSTVLDGKNKHPDNTGLDDESHISQ